MSVVEQRRIPSEPKDVIKGDDALNLFVRNLAKFDRQFCKSMFEGLDFTLRLEVRGVGGDLVHVRVYTDEVDKLKAVRE